MKLTPYPDANGILALLAERVRGVLGERLTGLYLYGSLTSGDYDPGISDIDLLAAVATDLTPVEYALLLNMHIRLAREQPEWDNRVEVAYLSEHGLKTFRTERSPIWVISPGEPFHMKDAGADWLANWHSVRESGLAVHGPPPAALIGPVSREEYVACIRGYAAQMGGSVHNAKSRGGQAYAILTMCRALHLARTGRQASKRQAAEWVMVELPEWSELIGQALGWRLAQREQGIDHAQTRAETVRFVLAVRDMVRPGSG